MSQSEPQNPRSPAASSAQDETPATAAAAAQAEMAQVSRNLLLLGLQVSSAHRPLRVVPASTLLTCPPALLFQAFQDLAKYVLLLAPAAPFLRSSLPVVSHVNSPMKDALPCHFVAFCRPRRRPLRSLFPTHCFAPPRPRPPRFHPRPTSPALASRPSHFATFRAQQRKRRVAQRPLLTSLDHAA